MTKYNLQSISFALVVLILVIMGQAGSTVGEETFAPNNIRETSLAAHAFNAQLDDVKTPQNINKETRATKSVSRERLIIFARPEPVKPITPLPKITASSALVKELDSDSAIFQKNIKKRWPLASITKLMTAVVAKEIIRPEQKIIMSENAVLTEGRSGNFKIGEAFVAYDLIKAMLTISSNDAAVALADFYGYQEFISLMRKKAFEIGMHETVFFDPAGLSVLNQSTILDLEKLTSYILKKHPAIFAISRKTGTKILELKTNRTREIPSNNKFAGLPNFIGGKTGYTDEASGNLISIFEYKGRKFLIIVFGTESRFKETQNLYNWLRSNL